MEFLKSLFGSGQKSQEPEKPELVELRGNGEYALEIVGESHYQNALEDICGPRKEKGENKKVEAFLHLDDDNPYDNKAVRVQIDGKVVGHLSREVARLYRQQLKQGGHPRAIGTCDAVIRGGWERKGKKGNYGVWLDIPVE